ncbi:MAG: 4Fe-4S dicluster domain-containing protein [bacterium]
MKQAEREIISNTKKLLADNRIDVFIGYEQGTLPFRTSPCFVHTDPEVQKLVWNSFCANNLSVYLPHLLRQRKGHEHTRVGILCKGCDNRSVVELIKEKQLSRDDIVIIGISCAGIVDSTKLQSRLNGGRIIGFDETPDAIVVRLENEEKTFKKSEFLCEACRHCAHPIPNVYDILVRSEQLFPQPVVSDPRVTEFRARNRDQRWRTLEHEMSKCIRCYACRNACPNCYCKECFAEQTAPKWIGVTNDLSDIIFFHVMRIFHQAGRCVDCGACVRACPMGVDLRLFTRMLVDEVTDRFGYEPGLSTKDNAPLSAYRIDDEQTFMVEPE